MKQIAISKEHLDKIRGLTAIKPEERFDYTPKGFRDLPPELQPVFKLQTVSGLDIVLAEDSLRGSVRYSDTGTEIVLQRGAQCRRICATGLIGWSNYYMATGEIMEWDDKAGIDANMGKISPEILHELANEIIGRTRLTEDERLG